MQWAAYCKCSVVFALVVLLLHFPAITAEPAVRYLAENGSDSEQCLTDSTEVKPCRTLGYALSSETISNFELQVFPGIYDYGENETAIARFANLSIRKVPESTGDVVFRCSSFSEQFNDLSLFSGQNFSIYGITVQDCGPRSAGIFVENTDGVFVSNCIFRENIGAGLTLYNSSNVVVKNCTFINNTGMRADLLANTTTFNFRTYSTGGLVIIFNSTTDASVIVSSCYFINNTASVSSKNANDPRPHSFLPVGSGGAMLIRFSNFTNNTVVSIIDCNFLNNEARYRGGSVYVPIIQHPKNNSLLILNSNFESSFSNGTGGAITVDVFDVEESNTISIHNTTFRNGVTWYGGGAVSLILEDSLAFTTRMPDASPTIATFINCTFENNTCLRGGSAVILVSNARVDQSSYSASFIDCTFTKNNATDAGTILAYRFPIQFNGSNSFMENTGGGVALLQARMDITGNLRFENNSALTGGAIKMQEQSVIILHEGTEVNFVQNSAIMSGGAIYVEQLSSANDILLLSLFNTLCFLQFEIDQDESKRLTPDEWRNVSVMFANNTATTAGAAVFTADLKSCTFTTTECEKDASNTTVYEMSIFSATAYKEGAKSPLLFGSGNRIADMQLTPNEKLIHEVATQADNLTVIPDTPSAAPGDKITFELRAHDQSGNRREVIWAFEDSGFLEGNAQFFSLSNTEDSQRYSLTFQVNNTSQELCTDTISDILTEDSPEHLEFYIIEALNGQVSTEIDVEINIACCHPGYYYVAQNRTCVFNSDFPHLLRPTEDNRHVYLQPGYYAGYYNDTSLREAYFATALLPSVFQRCTEEGNRTGCLYMYDNPDAQCAENRTGYICGKCPEGYGVDLTLRQCKKCTTADAVGLTLICLLIVAFCVFVLVFNIGLSNDLKGFLFYAQVVGYVYQNGALNASWDFHVSRFLGFSLYLPICPFTNLPALWTTAFGFLPSILTILTVVVYVICARRIKALSQRSAFNGIWLLFLLVYKYIADTTANFFKCVKVEGPPVEERHHLKLIFFYDGNVPCFSGQHLILAIPSIILFVAIAGLAPVFIVIISFKRFKKTQPFTDVITEGIGRQCRWWSGFDLLRRLLFILVVTIFDFVLPEYKLALCFSTLIVLATVCIAKPYEKTWKNVVEALILFDLLLVAIHFLNEREYRRLSTHNFPVVLLLAPFIYALLNLSIRITSKLWKSYVPIAAMKMKDYISMRTHRKAKPSLHSWQVKSTAYVELLELQETSTDSGDWHESLEDSPMPDHPQVDYSQLREELLD